MEKGGWLNLPLYRLTKKRMPRARGLNLEPFEKALKKDYFFRSVGKAIQDEYGKRLTFMEYINKSKVPIGFRKKKRMAIQFESLGMQGILRRVNIQLRKQIKKKREKEKRRKK